MFAITAAAADPASPLDGLVLGEHPDPQVPDGWVRVRVRAASLNHHDLWTLRGVGLDRGRLPIVLGCDASGTLDTGEEVIVHAVVGEGDGMGAPDGDETLDPTRSLLSERYDGTFADWVVVPRRNLVPKPASLTFEEAACLPTAWLTAYRMLFTRGAVRPGETILVQGAGGGVATAAIALARAAGIRVWATSRSEDKRERARSWGAHEVFEPGARLPARVDAVIETVGEATWSHSLKSLRPGGRIVIAGATSGQQPPADLARVFFTQLQVIGSTMGTISELRRLVTMLEATGVRPLIDEVMPMVEGRRAFERMMQGDVFGKLVLTTQ
jgi:NADPH:quinone reductase-like Zn-dependent oxidoreductase